MVIRGLQKLTLLDYPGKLAATVFLGGCNFRCPFCHNASLVLGTGGESISEDEFFSFLDKRRGVLEAVCVSGGEPTLHEELPTFIKKIRARGFLVKLDTNGYRPEVLSSLISEGLLDYVAMDIKSSREGYAVCAGVSDFDVSLIEKSVGVLRRGTVDYEFRTTVVKGLHTEEDIREIGKWLAGEKKLYLQPFRDSGDILGEDVSAYSEAEINRLLEVLREFVPSAQIRG